jgi:hypothetical protein
MEAKTPTRELAEVQPDRTGWGRQAPLAVASTSLDLQ